MTISSYKWWTVFGWWEERQRGAKLGPITACWFHGFGERGWFFYLGLLNRVPVYDGLMRRLKSRP